MRGCFASSLERNYFGGVSGGGLWRVQIYHSPESGHIESKVVLEGIAFYELGTGNGKGIVRCHGVQSIEKALAGVPIRDAGVVPEENRI